MLSVICKCPKCGGTMIDIYYTTNPPIAGLQCNKCGYEMDLVDYQHLLQDICDNLYKKGGDK